MSDQLYKRPYWFGGTSYREYGEQWGRFKKEGIWEMGWPPDEKPIFASRVKAIQPFDLIAARSKNTPSGKAAQLLIRALGVVIRNRGEETRKGGHPRMRLDVLWLKEFGDFRRCEEIPSGIPGGGRWRDAIYRLEYKPEDKGHSHNRIIDFAFWGIGGDASGVLRRGGS